MWIISHPHVIPYPVANCYITANFDDGIRLLKTGLNQKMLLQVYVRELYIEMQKNMLLGSSWHTMKNRFPY